MHWIHRRGQGWLVVGLGAALMGGCGAAAGGRLAADSDAAADTAQSVAAEKAPAPVLTFDDVVGLPPVQVISDAMPLLPGANVSNMPIVQPEERAVAMPGAIVSDSPAGR